MAHQLGLVLGESAAHLPERDPSRLRQQGVDAD